MGGLNAYFLLWIDNGFLKELIFLALGSKVTSKNMTDFRFAHAVILKSNCSIFFVDFLILPAKRSDHYLDKGLYWLWQIWW